MTTQEAIEFARRWTADLRPEENYPMFQSMKTLLDHINQQEKDIKHLTDAVRAGMVRNKELMNELSRSKKTR
jgi:hypothetical protein